MPTSGEMGDPAASAAPAGGTIGKYAVVRLIGRGGMGLVHEALHPELRKRVAIKSLLPEMAAMPGALQRFLQEGEAASRIKHPNVVNVLDVGTHQGLPFLVMEYLEGESLAERFARAPGGPIDETVDLLLPAIAAVAAGHDEGVIHRDLKPANIFLERNRRGGVTPKVLDFGISKIVGTASNLSLTGNVGLLGTLSYIAPEQAENARTVDGRADQYAFGLILYEGLTGRRAFDEKQGLKILVDIINGRIDPPRLLRFAIPAGLEAVMLRALRVSPAERFPSLRGLGAALLPFASQRQRLLWEEAFSEKVATIPPMARTISLGEFPPTPSGPLALGPGSRHPPSTLQHSATASPDEHELPLRPRRRGLAWSAVALVLGAAGIYAATALRGRARELPPPPPAVAAPAPPPPTTYLVKTRVVPPAARIELDDQLAGHGSLERELVADGRTHRLRVTLEEYHPQSLTFDEANPLPTQIVLAPVARPERAPARKPERARTRPAAPPDLPAPSRPPRRSVNNSPILH
jgi:serine/threonine protein kinase